MKLTLKFAQYVEVKEGLCTMDDVNTEIISFIEKHGLTDICWPTFVLEGECNVKKKVVFHDGMDCLFG